MKKMKFTIEFEVPEDIESFIGVELFLHTIKDGGYPWESVMLFCNKKQRVRDGKHLHFDGDMCTVKAVGELTKEENVKIGDEQHAENERNRIDY